MPKYVFAYHGGGTPESESDQAAVMEAWTNWYGELGQAIADGGAPVGNSKTVAPDGTVSDGGGANPLTGYTLVEASDIDAAVTMAKGCPILTDGGSVEVAETFDMA